MQIQHLQLFSKPIPPTSIAGLDSTLKTFEDVVRQVVEAFLTAMWARDVPPVGVCAIVSHSQHVCGIGHSLNSDGVVRRHVRDVTVDQDVCSSQQSILVPLITATVFPLNTTDVAELSSTTASSEGQFTSFGTERSGLTSCGCSRRQAQSNAGKHSIAAILVQRQVRVSHEELNRRDSLLHGRGICILCRSLCRKPSMLLCLPQGSARG